VVPALSTVAGVYDVLELVSIIVQLGQVDSVGAVGSTELLVATASQ